MRPPFQVNIRASADASAQGDSFQVSGLIEINDLVLWFSESWKVVDLKPFDVPVRPDAQRDIACYETFH